MFSPKDFLIIVFVVSLATCIWTLQHKRDLQKQHMDSISFDFPVAEIEAEELFPATNMEKVEKCREDKECHILAKTLVYEARSESYKGAEMVARVVIERARTQNRWPNTVEGVIKQPHQFSFWGDMERQATPTKEDWTRGWVIAYNVLYEEHLLGEVGVVPDHYHTTAIHPYWADSLDRVATIGGHHFYTTK